MIFSVIHSTRIFTLKFYANKALKMRINCRNISAIMPLKTFKRTQTFYSKMYGICLAIRFATCNVRVAPRRSKLGKIHLNAQK